MRRYATQVASYVQGMTFDDFAPESLLRLGVERGIEVVDEAAGRVSTSVREAHSEVPWGQIIALRNVIAHGYATVNGTVLWAVATRDIPELIEAVDRILPSNPDGEAE